MWSPQVITIHCELLLHLTTWSLSLLSLHIEFTKLITPMWLCSHIMDWSISKMICACVCEIWLHIYFIDSYVELCEMLPWVSSPGQPLSLGQGDGGPERERGHNISTHLRYSISMLIYTMPSEDKHKCIVTHTCMSTSFLIIFPSAHIRPPRASPVKTEAFSMRLTSSPPYQHRY
jgi:hypothetical protein